MKKSNINYYFITIIFFILIFLFNMSIFADSIQIDEINFKNAEVQDVLRTIADIFNKNIVLDDSVTGEITISLKKVGFEESLKLITNAKDLKYKVDNNTIFVATSEKINKLYESQKMQVIDLEYIDSEEIITLVKNMFKELRVGLLPNDNQLLLKGVDKNIDEAVNLINTIDKKEKLRSNKEINEKYEIIKIYSENYTMVLESLKAMYSDLTIVESENKDNLLIYGKKEKIEEAKKIINRLNVNEGSDSIETKEKVKVNITKRNIVDYIPLEDASQIIESNYSDLNINKNPDYRELILKGEESAVKNAANFLDEIDRPQRQVMIEVRVEEISRSDVEELGIKSLGDDNTNLPRIKFIKEGEKIDAVEMQWPDILDYLGRNSRSETLANPHLITLNGKEGRLLIGDRIPVKTTNSEGTESINYIEAGITLEFLPWISEDDIIRLDVSPTVSSLGEAKYEGFPTIQTREVETTLNLKDGETFAIGGLIQEDSSNSKSEVPYFSDIPILGELFKRRDNENSKTELLIFITPKIINDYENHEQEEKFEFLD